MLLQMAARNIPLLKDPGFLVNEKKYRVGRISDCSFVVKDLSVSRVHAELTGHGDTILVTDLDSMNGTFVDRVRVSQAQVKPDQIITFGSAEFQLVGHDLSDIAQPSTIAPFRESFEPLSEAQQRVLEHLLKGCSEKEAANLLKISPNTVHAHVSVIYRKYKVSSRGELLAMFVSESKYRQLPKR